MDPEIFFLPQVMAADIAVQHLFQYMGIFTIHGVENQDAAAFGSEQGKRCKDQMRGATAEAEIGPRNSAHFRNCADQAIAMYRRRCPGKKRKVLAQMIDDTGGGIEPGVQDVGADDRLRTCEIVEGGPYCVEKPASVKCLRYG